MNKSYTITNISKMLGIATSKIRYWEKEFSDYIKPVRDSRNRRIYSDSDLKNLKKIQNLTEDKGLKLDGVRRALSYNHDVLSNIATIFKSALFELEHGIPLEEVVEKYTEKLTN